MVLKGARSAAPDARWGARVVQMRYMLGDSGRSLMAGWGRDPPTHIQNRAASCPPPPNVCNVVRRPLRHAFAALSSTALRHLCSEHRLCRRGLPATARPAEDAAVGVTQNPL